MNFFAACQRRLKLHLIALSLVAAAAIGCGTGTFSATDTPVQVTIASGAKGVFMGGQQPVGGVAIRVYQTSSTYGGASTAVSPVFYTAASGNFNFPAITCTSGTQLYMVGTGGQPIAAVGATPAVTNNNLALMTTLGACSNSTFTSSSFFTVNELTSVGAIFALAPFMSAPTSIGAPPSNATGLAQSFDVVNQVVDINHGALAGSVVASPAPTATLPAALINTLADIMEQCINSGGGSASDTSTGCGKLFSYTPNSSGAYPTDTLTAMLNIAKLPNQNVAALNSLRSASPVFVPTLSVNSPPSSWNIAISYAPAGISTPSAVATDAGGNVWFTNKGTASISKLDYNGNQLFNVTGTYSAPSAIAIDLTGNAWVTNSGNNTLAKQGASGGAPTVFSGNGLTAPRAVAIDANGNVFVTNTSSVSSFTSAGAVLAPPYTAVSAPLAATPTPR